jgi:hypothetical protein
MTAAVAKNSVTPAAPAAPAAPAPALPPQVAIRAELDRPYVLPAGAAEQYRREGFIKLKDVFSKDLLDYYAVPIAADVARHTVDQLPIAARNTYGKAFQQVMNQWTRDVGCREFTFGKRLAGIATALMGTRGVRVYHDQALFKEPGGGFTPWHADQYYWPLTSGHSVTAWVPLQAVPQEMGPLAFAVGSHRLDGRGRELEISDESEAVLGKTLNDFPKLDAPFDLGEVSFHAGWTFHRAGPNTTDRLRKVMTVIYIDSDMIVGTPETKGQEGDLRGWFPGLKPGDLAASPLNPQLYP